MPSSRSTRRHAGLLVLIALVGGVLTVAPAATARVSVLHGSTYRTRIFPDDFFSLRDTGNITGKRVNFRKGIDYPACNSSNYSICDGFAMLNTLDGFDLQPRVTVPFSGPIFVGSVNLSDFYVRGPGGRTGLSQLVWDPATKTLSGITNAFLREASRYQIVVTRGIKDARGNPIDACGGTCTASFTTRSASAELDHIRRALDSGAAYAKAGISNRKLSFVQNRTADVFTAASV